MNRVASKTLISIVVTLSICVSAAGQTGIDFLSLETARETLIQKNLAIEAARLEVSGADQARVYARLRPRPGLTVSAENLRLAGPTPFNRLYEVGAVVTQPLELGGQRRAATELAGTRITLAEARLDGVLRQRLAEMRRVFFEALSQQSRLAIEEENSRNFDELLRYSEVRLQEGEIAPSEVLKLRLERIKYTSALANARLGLRQSKIRLLELLGTVDFSRVEQLELREPFGFVDYGLSASTLRQSALESRPEIKIAEAELVRAEASLRLERARSKGTVEPFVGYRRVGIDNTVLAGVNVPLPFGNRNQAAIAQAEADRKIADTTLLQTRNRTVAEVEAAYASLETAREQVKAFEFGILRQADQSLDIALLSYREGSIDLLNLLEAQRTRSDVRASYYQALLAYYNAIFQLELLTGKEIRN